MGSIMNERALKGIKLRFLIPENLLSPDASPSTMTRNIEGRGLPDIPAILAVTEKEAAVCFRLVEGRMDYAGFYGKAQYSITGLKTCFSTIGKEESAPSDSGLSSALP